MANTLPEIDSNFWKCGRLNSYEHWPYQSSQLSCNPDRMAAAGFICIGGKDEPDLVECFMCFKQLDGWDATDDPWQEHANHKVDCPYILLNKPNEKLWTIEELFQMAKEYYVKQCTRQKELMMNLLNTERAKLVEQIPIIYKSIQRNKKNLQ